jgi:hypothetical protein
MAPSEGTQWVAAAADVDPKASSAGDIDTGDDDEPGQFDLADALIQALAEFTGEVQAAAAASTRRCTRATAEGQFRNVVDRILHALGQWSRGDGSGDKKDALKDPRLQAGRVAEGGHPPAEAGPPCR